jgi:hypothetical protein
MRRLRLQSSLSVTVLVEIDDRHLTAAETRLQHVHTTFVTMTDSNFEPSLDWDLFSSLQCSQNVSTPTTMPDIIGPPMESRPTSSGCDNSTQLRNERCLDHAEEAYLFPTEQFIKREFLDHEFSLFTDQITSPTDTTEISSEDLFPILSSPSQTTTFPLSSKHTPSPLTPHDHLHNLPPEIVHRPRYPLPLPKPVRDCLC